MEKIFKKINYCEEKVGHLHPEHEQMEEIIESGQIKAKKVKFGRLTVPRFGK